ncbi:MAG: hypothetical protein KJ884_11745 [Gammaproteobacteria bacterium]|nr:hypothetical protein [Gammaproteobacteria bacterium]MBU2215520.1 hypothetical protein [Gammaproteobacteria bacterium]MBU2323625.1 hypothetical protein [Gammaproteobacteria bacterium]
MMPSGSRCLAIAMLLALAGCQQATVAPAPVVDPLAPAYQQLEQHLSSGHLEQAHAQFDTLKAQAPADSRLEPYQRLLAEAYLQQSQTALQRGDLDAATQALIRARSLLPQAPALGTKLPGPPPSARDAKQ